MVSGGTDTHLMLVNLTNKSITGRKPTPRWTPRASSSTRMPVPYDEKPPAAIASSIRLSTDRFHPRHAQADMREIVALIDRVLQHAQNQTVQAEVRAQAKALQPLPLFHAYVSSPA
ncbi:MAG: hypothetical protein U0231_06890 [Nitrospiraceae bacterium]